MNIATVTESFRGVEDGKIHPRKFSIGEEISGSLAKSMVDAGKAEWIDPELKKKPPENKALEGPGRNKQCSVSPQGQVSQNPTVKKSRGRRRKS